MRRISVAIITMLMVMILSLSSLFGCNLITTNNKRDMRSYPAKDFAEALRQYNVWEKFFFD